MGIAPEAKLIVKHTFLEFVHDSPLHKESRVRAQTDSALICGMADLDALSSGSAYGSSEDESTPVIQRNSASILDAQPDSLSANAPTDSTYFSTRQFPWCVAETGAPWPHYYDASAWDCRDAWWVPDSYGAGVGPDASKATHIQQSSSWSNESTNGRTACRSLEDMRTTVMLRNLPNNYTREMLLSLIDSEGFAGEYDFIYLPIDFNSQAGLGYGFVNLVTPGVTHRFWQHFDGFSRWGMPSDKVCTLNWSSPHQGLAAHIERYRNSPVMHEAVPDECRPMLFMEGVRIPFPPPTKQLKAPRLRVRESAKASRY